MSLSAADRSLLAREPDLPGMEMLLSPSLLLDRLERELPLQPLEGVEMKLVLSDEQAFTPKLNPAIIKVVAEAHSWFEALKCGRVGSIG